LILTQNRLSIRTPRVISTAHKGRGIVYTNATMVATDFVVADLETQQERDYYDKKYSKQQIEMHGFKELVFSRESFLFRIVHRHYGKQFNWGPKAMRRAKPLFQLLKWMDRRLAKKQFMKKNGLMLVWGFKK
jgi:hypothetical protein